MSGKVLTRTIMARQFYRYTFALSYQGLGYIMTHTLLVNPEDLSFDEPARAEVTQTFGGAYVTDFGAGLPTVTISGTTGYSARTNSEGELTDGYHEFKSFRNRVYRGFIETNEPGLKLFWFDWENDEHYEIQPLSFRLMRNKAEPLLYRYEFRFTCLRRIKSGKQKYEDYVQPVRTVSITPLIGTSISILGEQLNRLE